MRILNTIKIIGVLLITILIFTQAGTAYAIYSPKLNSEVIQIKKHVQEARRINGVGTLKNAWDKVTQENLALKEEGKAYGTPGLYKTLVGNVKEIILNTSRALGGAGVTGGLSFVDSFYLIFITFLDHFNDQSVCWRDDIWALQALQEEVVNEMFKAGLLNDTLNANILLEDYKNLHDLITALKSEYTNTAKWFETGQQNYYTDCPYGEFDQAFENLTRSWDQLSASFTGDTTSDWGSLYTMAQQNAKRKAAQWVKANKLTATFGGEAGANPQSIMPGPGAEKLVGQLKTGAEFAKEYGKMIYENTIAAFEPYRAGADIDDLINAYNDAKEAQEFAEKQVKTNIKYNLQLSDVAENSLIGIEQTLSLINGVIVQTSEEAVMQSCEKLNIVLKEFNKGKGDPVKCNE